MNCNNDKKYKSQPGQLENLDVFADSLRKDWRIPGIAIVVVKNDKILYKKGFGYRDVERALPVTSKTLFAIGSATKPFTAMSLKILASEGKIDLDKPIAHYLSDFKLFNKPLTDSTTTRDFLTHRTGIPGYDALLLITSCSREEYFSRMKYLEPNQEFRQVFQYSNLGYMSTGIILERLTGSTWEKYVSEKIFNPLKMRSSNFSILASLDSSDVAQPYLHKNDSIEKIKFRNVDQWGPSSSINSNLEDLAKWLIMINNQGIINSQQIISRDDIAELFQPQIEIKDQFLKQMMQADYYGLGWGIRSFNDHTMVSHGGNIDGFSSFVGFIPEEKIGVAVLTNTLNMASYPIAYHIFESFLGIQGKDWNSDFKAQYTSIISAMRSRLSELENTDFPPPSLELIQYSGKYFNLVYDSILIELNGKGLIMKFSSGISSVLHHKKADLFIGKTTDFYLPLAEVQFSRNDSEEVENLSMQLQPGVNKTIFERIK